MRLKLKKGGGYELHLTLNEIGHVYTAAFEYAQLLNNPKDIKRTCKELGRAWTKANEVPNKFVSIGELIRMGRPPTLDLKRVREMRKAGASYEKISEAFGVTRGAIANALKRAR